MYRNADPQASPVCPGNRNTKQMSTDQWWNRTDRRQPKYSEQTLTRRCFVHHKSHMDRSVSKPGLRSERPLSDRLNHGTAVKTE